MGGALYGPSSYFMQSPPEQYTDDVCRAKVETFIAGSDHFGQPEFVAAPAQPVGI